MPQQSSYCPFCNAPVDQAEAAAGGGRLTCRQCGETFPGRAARSRPGELGLQEQRQAREGPAFDDARRFAPPSRWSNRRLAAGIVSLMGLMALGGLTLALMTQQTRRQRDFANSPQVAPSPTVRFLPPDELPGLAYLPDDVDVVAGMDFGQIAADPDFAALVQPGSGPVGVALERWAGLAPQDIAAVVAGLKLTSQTPQAVVVVQASRRIDSDKVRDALNEATLPEVALRFPTPETVVVLFPKREAERAASKPRSSPAAPASVAELLREHVSRAAALWVVGRTQKLGLTWPALVLAALPPDIRMQVATIRTFALWGRPGKEMTITGSLECADEKSAAALAAALERWKPQAAKVSSSVSGTWVALQIRATTDTLRRRLEAAGDKELK